MKSKIDNKYVLRDISKKIAEQKDVELNPISFDQIVIDKVDDDQAPIEYYGIKLSNGKFRPLNEVSNLYYEFMRTVSNGTNSNDIKELLGGNNRNITIFYSSFILPLDELNGSYSQGRENLFIEDKQRVISVMRNIPSPSYTGIIQVDEKNTRQALNGLRNHDIFCSAFDKHDNISEYEFDGSSGIGKNAHKGVESFLEIILR